MIRQTGNELARLIAKRHLCLTQLRDLGHKQSDLISTGEISGLLRLISAKNPLIAALQAVERELIPYHSQNPDQRTWTSPGDRETCAQQVAQCKRLLDEVMAIEKENEQKMIRRRDEVAARLQTVQQTSVARSAYQAQQFTTSSTAKSKIGKISLDANRLDIHSGS